jgi:hypothetical protein
LHNGTLESSPPEKDDCDKAEAKGEEQAGSKDSTDTTYKVMDTDIPCIQNKPATKDVDSESEDSVEERKGSDSAQAAPAADKSEEDVEAMQVDGDGPAESSAATETTDKSNGEVATPKSPAPEAARPLGPTMRFVNETEAYEDSDKEDNDKDDYDKEDNEDDVMDVEEEEGREGAGDIRKKISEEDGSEREKSEDSDKSQGEGEKTTLKLMNGDSKLLEAEKNEEDVEKEAKKMMESESGKEEKKVENEKEDVENGGNEKEKGENEKDDEAEKGENEKEEEAKKPTLKLASFADITEKEMEKNQESRPSHGFPVHGLYRLN